MCRFKEPAVNQAVRDIDIVVDEKTIEELEFVYPGFSYDAEVGESHVTNGLKMSSCSLTTRDNVMRFFSPYLAGCIVNGIYKLGGA